jgi:hypothetical protein
MRHKPEIGDIWYNDTYGFHVLLMEANDGGWRQVYVFELDEDNWYRDDDFQDHYWEWKA